MKKLLVWDGDNTLWQGKVIEGTITLSDDRKQFCQELASRGVVQAVASFNLQADIDAILHSNGLTDYFPVNKAAFDTSKSILIQQIMDELGLVNHSDVVFVDDEAFNRNEVAEALPGIIVIEPRQLRETMVVHFSKAQYTQEDRDRVRMYRAATARKTSGQAYGEDRTAFLRSCAMSMTIFQPTHLDKPRVDDLIVKANRMSAKSWHVGDMDLWAMLAKDKFGSYGVSGVIGLTGNVVKLLVISCRLQGMGYGSAFLGSFINRFVGSDIIAEWVATEYNAGVRSLYEWYDFEIACNESHCTAAKFVERPVILPDWITFT